MVKKRIVYSEHLLYRLKVRKIENELPRKIFLQANHYYSDTITGSKVAIGIANYFGKQRELAVIFVDQRDCCYLITIHPLRDREMKKRVASGRWVKDVR